MPVAAVPFGALVWASRVVAVFRAARWQYSWGRTLAGASPGCRSRQPEVESHRDMVPMLGESLCEET